MPADKKHRRRRLTVDLGRDKGRLLDALLARPGLMRDLGLFGAKTPSIIIRIALRRFAEAMLTPAEYAAALDRRDE